MQEPLVLFAAGILAGALGGMLGIGGGVVLLPLLRFGLGLSPASAAGTCVLGVFCTTLGGSYRYCRLGLVLLRPLLPVILSGLVATALFSWLFLALAVRGGWLDLGIGLVFCLISGRMIFEGIRGPVREGDERAPAHHLDAPLGTKIAIGAAAGALPGLLGIGTGGILVPAFALLLKWPIKNAMAASLVCFCINAAVSASFKLAQGFVVLDVAVPICLGTLLGANLGAILNQRFASRVLKTAFGLLFSYVALQFILSCIKAGT
jgi:uncharacterized protein